jgi:hypothetical protein
LPPGFVLRTWRFFLYGGATMPVEADYAAQKINDKRWKVHKFDGHHGRYETYYEVIKPTDGPWFCTCKAGHECKHIKLVMEQIHPKKSLF